MNIVFVGNGVMTHDLSHIVDAADIVIRSQHCANYLGMAGTKTNILCIRPSNEPFGTETATELRIPKQAALHCKHLLMCHRNPRPDVALLLRNYPQLRHVSMTTFSEEPTRKLLVGLGANIKRDDGQLNPTMGMVLLHQFVERKLYRTMNLCCVGFSWGYSHYDDHDADIEQMIQRGWEQKGFMRFIHDDSNCAT